jgi:FkbH-like protein
MDFVIDSAFKPGTVAAPSRPPVCKCVVWDLDHTLWEGILIEDGPENIRLKAGIVEILKQLDERGILISAVSKNNHDDAIALLRQFDIADYFLFPQISWNPKSQGIKEIAKNLNIGIDTLLFVDDSPFEREEVRSECKDVMVLDAAEYQNILDRPDCQAAVTAESRGRRLFYRDQQRREHAQEDFLGEYVTFLRDCNLRLTVQSMTAANLERVHELTQRTNQMNFSGNRYSREQLQSFLQDLDIDAYVLDCEDRFGSYGTIGFCLVDRSGVCMTDLMFSCRIQGKRVEHAFVSHLIRKYRQIAGCSIKVNYRKTPKNAGPGKVFADLGFQVVGEVDGLTRLAFPLANAIQDEGIVSISDLTAQINPCLIST